MYSELRKLAAWLRQEERDREQRRLEKCAKLAMALVSLETLRRKIHEV
jgi:hypothetical protein